MVDIVAARGPVIVIPARTGFIYVAIKTGITLSVEPSISVRIPLERTPIRCIPIIIAPTTTVP